MTSEKWKQEKRDPAGEAVCFLLPNLCQKFQFERDMLTLIGGTFRSSSRCHAYRVNWVAMV